MSTDPKAPADKPADAFAILGDFKPKAPGAVSKDTPEISKDIQKVAEANGFLSREAKPATPAKRARFNSAAGKAQLNIKVPEAVRDRFYSMAEERRIRVLGDLLEQALDALEKADPPR